MVFTLFHFLGSFTTGTVSAWDVISYVCRLFFFSSFYAIYLKFLLQLWEKQEMIHSASDSYRNEPTSRVINVRERLTVCCGTVNLTILQYYMKMCVSACLCVCNYTNHWHLQTCGIHTSSLLSPVSQWHTDHVWPWDNRPKPPSGHSCDPIAFPGNLCVRVCACSCVHISVLFLLHAALCMNVSPRCPLLIAGQNCCMDHSMCLYVYIQYHVLRVSVCVCVCERESLPLFLVARTAL